ncbi:MAG: YhcH/YjgK/YiaL family protein [Tepidisphaeraceae bacterium]
MVFDRIENADLYANLSPRIALALRALRDTDLARRDVGRYDLQGEDVYAMVQKYETRPAEKIVWESHRKYIDVQYLASGVERMGWAQIKGMTVTTPYDEKNDCLFYGGTGSTLLLTAGMFTIYFPEDVHAPGLAVDKPMSVNKTVIKVRVG